MKITTPQSIFPLVFVSVLSVGCQAEKQSTGAVVKSSEVVEQVTQASAQKVALVTAEEIAIHPGKALHDANCISCHDSAVYTRKDRKMTDFPMLLAQVQRCDANLGARLFDEEIEQVAAYLNKAYYQYEK